MKCDKASAARFALASFVRPTKATQSPLSSRAGLRSLRSCYDRTSLLAYPHPLPLDPLLKRCRSSSRALPPPKYSQYVHSRLSFSPERWRADLPPLALAAVPPRPRCSFRCPAWLSAAMALSPSYPATSSPGAAALVPSRQAQIDELRPSPLSSLLALARPSALCSGPHWLRFSITTSCCSCCRLRPSRASTHCTFSGRSRPVATRSRSDPA